MANLINVKATVGYKDYYPRGFYYTGKYPKLKVVLIECKGEVTKKLTFDIDDVQLYLMVFNKFGDEYSINS